MGVGCGWRHAPNRWSWEFEDFEKRVSWKLKLDHVGRGLSSLPWRWELGIRPLNRRVEFFRSLLAEMNWDLKHHKMGSVRIVFFTSYRRIEVKKLINRSYLNNRARLYLHTPVFAYASISLYLHLCITVVLEYVYEYITMCHTRVREALDKYQLFSILIRSLKLEP